MKKFLSLGILVCLTAVAVFAAAAALPNYAGTWSFEKDKSKDVPEMMAANLSQMVVKQDDKTISVKQGAGDEIPYNLDGSKSKVQVTGRFPGEATVYLEKKDDGKVILHTEREINFQGSPVKITSADAWEITDGGKTLTSHRTVESPRGTQEMTLVFSKKS